MLIHLYPKLHEDNGPESTNWGHPWSQDSWRCEDAVHPLYTSDIPSVISISKKNSPSISFVWENPFWNIFINANS